MGDLNRLRRPHSYLLQFLKRYISSHEHLVLRSVLPGTVAGGANSDPQYNATRAKAPKVGASFFRYALVIRKWCARISEIALHRRPQDDDWYALLPNSIIT